ncbi:UNVERIFIED_CONTAM: Pentatricopeptide repeat-containing protein, mitochondrial [Sesamum latifolium]|uniref:Pentatricopeptide repeat-containing protein, mitochondrial n=1 Tax=Sesamum latifolium TaxID=2727402 RepID=A0AAW2W9M3_9LAMI
MWRPLARRALLNRGRAAQKLLPPVFNLQVPNPETLAPAESASGFSFFSAKSHVYGSLRFFSSNPAEKYEDPASEPPISEANEITGDFDFSAGNVADGTTKVDFENEDSIFDDAMENLDANKGVGENFEDSVSLDENLDYVAAEDESLGEVKKNDPETVESLLSLLQSSGTDTGSLESNMEGMDLVLDQEFVLKVLETPYIPGENLISFFRWILKNPEFKATTPVVDALVTAICMGNRRREAYALWDLINEVGEKEKGVVNTDCLNELIAEFSRLGKGKAAFDAFNKFEQFGCLLNADTYYLTIEALCKRSFYNWASSVCEKMLNAGNLPDGGRVGKIISYLCKGGLTKDAHLVYMYAKDKKTYLPRSSIDFLVGSLSRIEKTGKGTNKEINKELDRETVSLALEMLNDYSALDRKYATKPFSSVIKKLCWIEDVDRAKKLLLEMIDFGLPPGNTVFNCVINGLTKSGDMEEAMKMMKLLEKRGLKPDVYTYSVIMSGYARGGEMEEACKIYDEAKKQHAKLCPATFHTLIRGFCKLEQYDKAVSLIGEMKQHGVNPNHDEYNKLIKCLCIKALDWETAEKLQEEMRVNGLILNGRTSALIRAVKQLKEGVPS